MDVETRSDVYSLGVMLYELLTGSTPLEKGTLNTKSMLEVLAMIREQEPPRPSNRLSLTEEDTASSVGVRRQISPEKLEQMLRGELDWIVMKALEIDRGRRYETPSAFADDIQRFLNDEAVEARPPSTRYRLMKFVKKNKAAVGMAAFMVTMLLASSIISSYLWFNAASARDQADASAKRSNDILKIATDAFESADPQLGGGAQMTAKDLLFEIKDRMNESELDELAKAEMMHTITVSLIGLGEYQAAEEIGRQAWDIRKAKLGYEHRDTLLSAVNVADAMAMLGKTKPAVELMEKTVDQMKESLGEKDLDTLNAIGALGEFYFMADRVDKAIELIEATLKAKRETLGDEHEETIQSIGRLASAYHQAGRLEDAIRASLEALAKIVKKIETKEFEKDHPDWLVVKGNLGLTYLENDQAEQAIKIYEELIPIAEQKLSKNHRTCLTMKDNLGLAHYRNRDFETAVMKHEEVLKIRRQLLPPLHLDMLTTVSNLALAYDGVGENEKGLSLLAETVEELKKSRQPDDYDLLALMGTYGYVLTITGDHLKAIDMLEPVVTLMAESVPKKSQARANLAICYWELERRDDAIKMQEIAWEQLYERSPNSDDSLNVTRRLVRWYEQTQRFEKSIPPLKRLVAFSTTTDGLHHYRTKLRTVYRKLDKTEELKQQMEQDIAEGKALVGSHPASATTMLEQLCVELINAEEFSKAEEVARLCLDFRISHEPESWTRFNVQSLLGETLQKQKKFDLAKPMLEEGFEGLLERRDDIPQRQCSLD